MLLPGGGGEARRCHGKSPQPPRSPGTEAAGRGGYVPGGGRKAVLPGILGLAHLEVAVQVLGEHHVTDLEVLPAGELLS